MFMSKNYELIYRDVFPCSELYIIKKVFQHSVTFYYSKREIMQYFFKQDMQMRSKSRFQTSVLTSLHFHHRKFYPDIRKCLMDLIRGEWRLIAFSISLFHHVINMLLTCCMGLPEISDLILNFNLHMQNNTVKLNKNYTEIFFFQYFT